MAREDEAEGGGEAQKRKQAREPGESCQKIAEADRALLLADAERLQDFDHAGRVQAALHHDPGEHFQGRPVHARLPENLAEQPHAGDRRSGRPRAGRPISIFESGAILQYLGRKTGKFYPADERGRVEVEQWLFWQMGGIGPMAGQLHHFKNYAVETLNYAINRYANEMNRLYGVMNIRLKDREFIAGKYSIADMAMSAGPMAGNGTGRTSRNFPTSSAGWKRMKARPAVQRGMSLGLELRQGIDMKDPKVQAVLFGQRARAG